MTNELLQEYSQKLKKLTEVSNIETPADTGKRKLLVTLLIHFSNMILTDMLNQQKVLMS